MALVVPAVLPSSQKDFEETLDRVTRLPAVSRIQIDVVDGHFATPASWPYTAPTELETMVAQVESLPQLDRFEYEIDLMCLDAERAAQAWLALGASRLTFHAESVTDLPRLLVSTRKRYGDLISLGLALDLATDSALIEPCLGDIEYVQFMGIARIGKQAEPFDRRVVERVRAFRERYPELPVQVDGGVSLESARPLVALGVSNLIVGSALSRANDPAAAVAAFEELQSPFGV
ncbi:MAG: beta/alpha barrel domain-containing protein [Minisyncoccota bacterium]